MVKSKTNYVGIPQATIDQAVQDYLTRTNQITTINANQKTSDQTIGTNTKTFIPSIYTTAQLKVGSSNGQGSYNTIYTVPSGKVFICLSICSALSFQASSMGNAGGLRYYNASTNTTKEITRGYGCDVAGTYALPLPLSNLFVLLSGDYIEVGSSSTRVLAIGNVIGYEVSQEEFIRIK